MIKREQIPKESIREAWKVFSNNNADMADAIVAAINAWPHAHHVNHHERMKTGELASFDVVLPIILPLPQEKNDE